MNLTRFEQQLLLKASYTFDTDEYLIDQDILPFGQDTLTEKK